MRVLCNALLGSFHQFCDVIIIIADHHFPGELIEVSGEQFINQWIRPHFWFILFADTNTCNSATPPPSSSPVEYDFTFLNPDSQGDPNDHFGDDLRGKIRLHW